MSILLVDDSRAMRMILRRELRKAGWTDVVEAASVPEALELWERASIEMVISDWGMPPMTGMELLEAIRAGGSTAGFGFVASDFPPGLRARAADLGVSFVTTKPVRAADLALDVQAGMAGDGMRPDVGAARREATADAVLSGLFERPVSIVSVDPPRREMARAVVEYYKIGSVGSKSYAVVEMPLASSLSCALARIPVAEAYRWADAHVLSDAIQENLVEVANIMSRFAAPSAGGYSARHVVPVGEGERLAKGGLEWHGAYEISVAGYPSGRVGLLWRS